MGRIWDVSSHLRGRGLFALFATTAALAGGAQALAPAAASAWQVDCGDPTACKDDPGGGTGSEPGTDDGGTTDHGGTDGGPTTDTGGANGGDVASGGANALDSFQQLSGASSPPAGFDSPFNPDPFVDSLVRLGPGMPGLNEAVLKALERKGLLSETGNVESIVNGVLNLVNDCGNIADNITALGERRVDLQDAINYLGDRPRADQLGRQLGQVKGEIRTEKKSYHYMLCGKIRF
jgi:hypothetical protein